MPLKTVLGKIIAVFLISASAALADVWTPSSGMLGTIEGLEVLVNHDGDDIINVKFSNSTTYYYVSANNIANDAKFNRLYSILLQVQATGQEVRSVRTNGSNWFNGLRLGVAF